MSDDYRGLVPRLEKLAAAASPGPWTNGFSDGSGRPDDREGGNIDGPTDDAGNSETVVNGGRDDWGVHVGVKSMADAEFIAASRTATPLLCKTIRELVAMSGAEHWSTPELAATLDRARLLLDPDGTGDVGG